MSWPGVPFASVCLLCDTFWRGSSALSRVSCFSLLSLFLPFFEEQKAKKDDKGKRRFIIALAEGGRLVVLTSRCLVCRGGIPGSSRDSSWAYLLTPGQY